MKSLARNTIFNVLYEIANLIFPLAYSMYAARILLADGVGRVAFANNIVSYFLLVAMLGLPTYSLREMAKIRNDQVQKNKLFTEIVTLNALSTTFSLCVYFLLLLFNKNVHADFRLYVACSIPLFCNYLNIDWLYKGHEEYGYIAVRSIIMKIALAVALFVFIRERSDYIKYALIVSLATVGNYLFNVVHARNYVRFDFSHLELKKHIKPVFIFFSGVLLSSLYSGIDIFMLGILCDSAHVGYYTYAQRIIGIVITGCNAFAAAFLPRLSYYYEHDREAFLSLVEKGTGILLFITVPAATGLALLAPWIITLLYGNDFLPSSLTVQIFAVLVVIRGLGDLLCYQVVMSSGNERIRIPAVIVAVCVNVVLNFCLIKLFVHNGAAFASVVAELVVNFLQFAYVRKKVGVHIRITPVLQALFSSFVMASAILVFMHFFKHLQAFLPLTIGLGIITYFALNIISKNQVFMLVKERICISRGCHK